MLALVLVISIASLIFAGYLAMDVLGRDQGTTEMRRISDAIKSGAEAFLRRQNKTIALLALLLAAMMFIAYAGWQRRMDTAWQTSFSNPTANPAMIVVAGPVCEASEIDLTGRYLYSV